MNWNFLIGFISVVLVLQPFMLKANSFRLLLALDLGFFVDKGFCLVYLEKHRLLLCTPYLDKLNDIKEQEFNGEEKEVILDLFQNGV